MQTFQEWYGLRPIATPGTYGSGEAYLTWSDITGFNRIIFLPLVADLSDDVDIAVYQATNAEGTDAKVLDGPLSGAFADGADESRVGVVEVLASHLDDGFNYVTLQINPSASTVFSCLALLGEPYTVPPANGTPEGVAFRLHSTPA